MIDEMASGRGAATIARLASKSRPLAAIKMSREQTQ
jgi:hypothetical protein